MKTRRILRKAKEKIIISLWYLTFLPVFIYGKRRRFDSKQTIFISSFTRSGSTWLQQMFMADRSLISVFEPLHPKFGHRPETLSAKGLLRLNDENENEVLSYIENIFSSTGPALYWTLKLNSIGRMIRGNRLIIKSVRSNHLLEWMIQNFNFNYQPIVIIRHPLATCVSSKRLFKGKASLEERVDRWCKSYQYPLENPDKVRLVFYEDLKKNFEQRFEELKKDYDLNPRSVDYKKPSRSNFDKTFKFNHSLFNPQEYFTPDQLVAFQEILDKNQITVYSAFEAKPL